jgi:hypothetical protein
MSHDRIDRLFLVGDKGNWAYAGLRLATALGNNQIAVIFLESFSWTVASERGNYTRCWLAKAASRNGDIRRRLNLYCRC